MNSLFMNLIFIILLFIFLLISVSFLTILEQKGLSYIQLRKGPNKVSIFGLLQPFCDAIKLFNKEYMIPKMSNYWMYYFSPILALIISLMIWLSFPFIYKFLSFNMSFMYMLSCLSLSVYSIITAGWSSNSNYALLGGLRSIAQTISYEICLILMFLSYFIILFSLNLFNFFTFQKYLYFFFINIPISLVILIIFLTETNRHPFDFAEGESELVSGFNVEYSGGSFALIFLAEYTSILFMSILFCLMFFSKNMFLLAYFFKVMLVSFIFIWVRASFPRFRYDLLMYLNWKKYLPISLNYFFFFICFKFFLFFMI